MPLNCFLQGCVIHKACSYLHSYTVAVHSCLLYTPVCVTIMHVMYAITIWVLLQGRGFICICDIMISCTHDLPYA